MLFLLALFVFFVSLVFLFFLVTVVFLVMIPVTHTTGSKLLLDVLENTCARIMAAVSIYVSDPPLLNRDVSSARDRAPGEDAGVANLRVRELIKEVEIAGGIHHVVV